MKVYALTVHECWGWSDSTDTLVDIFFNIEDAKKAMKCYLVKTIKENNVNLSEKTRHGEDVWCYKVNTDRCIELTNKHDGWSCEHIFLCIVEKEVK